jgi:hypothetical protein
VSAEFASHFLDRIDSLCFAAPIFFHVTRFFFDVSDQVIP